MRRNALFSFHPGMLPRKQRRRFGRPSTHRMEHEGLVSLGPFYSLKAAEKAKRKIRGAEVIGEDPWRVVYQENPTKRRSMAHRKKRKHRKNSLRRRRRNVKTTFPFPVTAEQKRKLASWVRRTFPGRRVKVK